VLLAVAAILSNHVSELAIAEWGASQSKEVKHALGFHNGITPHQSTIHRLFRRLNEEEVEAAFRCFFRHHLNREQQERGATAVSIDGKAQRGRLKFEAEGTYPMHAVSVVDHQTGIVLTQGHVEPIIPPPKAVLAKTDLASKKAQTQADLLAKSWAEHGIYSDPRSEAVGREALVQHIRQIQRRFAGHHIVLTSGVDEHHECLRFTWARVSPEGQRVSEGIDFGEVGSDGRLTRITGFFGPPVPLPSSWPEPMVL